MTRHECNINTRYEVFKKFGYEVPYSFKKAGNLLWLSYACTAVLACCLSNEKCAWELKSNIMPKYLVADRLDFMTRQLWHQLRDHNECYSWNTISPTIFATHDNNFYIYDFFIAIFIAWKYNRENVGKITNIKSDVMFDKKYG